MTAPAGQGQLTTVIRDLTAEFAADLGYRQVACTVERHLTSGVTTEELAELTRADLREAQRARRARIAALPC